MFFKQRLKRTHKQKGPELTIRMGHVISQEMLCYQKYSKAHSEVCRDDHLEERHIFGWKRVEAEPRKGLLTIVSSNKHFKFNKDLFGFDLVMTMESVQNRTFQLVDKSGLLSIREYVV